MTMYPPKLKYNINKLNVTISKIFSGVKDLRPHLYIHIIGGQLTSRGVGLSETLPGSDLPSVYTCMYVHR